MFNWKDFLDKKIAVKCNNLELARDFLKACEEKDIKWSSGHKATYEGVWRGHSPIIMFFIENGCLKYDNRVGYFGSPFKIVEWCKQDEYLNVFEVLKFNEGSKFEIIYPVGFKEVVQIKEGTIYNLDLKREMLLNKGVLKCKFKPILNKTPVDFVEAIKEYENGKTIYCETPSGYKYTEYVGTDEHSKLIDKIGRVISIREILYYKWYIKED